MQKARDSSASGEGPFVWLEAGTSGGSSRALLPRLSPGATRLLCSVPRCSSPPLVVVSSSSCFPRPFLLSCFSSSVSALSPLSLPPSPILLSSSPFSLSVPVSVVRVFRFLRAARTLISIPFTPLILFLAAATAIPENARASLNRLARSLLAATDEAFSTAKRLFWEHPFKGNNMTTQRKFLEPYKNIFLSLPF